MRTVLLAAALLAVVSAPSVAESVEDGAPAMPPLANSPPAPPALAPPLRGPGTLLLPGDGVTATVDCAGRNVMIEGSDARYTLGGGCRSVTVQGQRNAVQAALQPGGRIAIAGDGNTVDFTLTGPGAPPVISVIGSASRAVALTGDPAQ